MAVNIQLKDFAANTAPVPADIIYSANSADSFNEVKITIEQLIAAYPGLLSIGQLTTAADQIIYTTDVDTYDVAPITAFGLSVIALNAGVTAPTAGALATWDANKNLSANNFLWGFTSIATAAGNTVLTVASTSVQEFTGSTTQTVTMPVTSTLVAGTPFTIINNSSGALTVNSSGGNLIQTVASGSQLDLICILTSGTTAASWQAVYVADNGGTVNPGLVNQLAYYSSAGNVVSGLATINNGVMTTDGSGVPGFTTTPALGVASATSLSFGGTAMSVFDVGTFTPTITATTPGDLNVTYGTRQGSYTRINNKVFFAASCVATNMTYTTASGTIRMGNFPIAGSSSSDTVYFQTSPGGGAYTPPANSIAYGGNITNGLTSAGLVRFSTASGNVAAVQIGSFATANGVVLAMNGYYFV